MFDLYKKMANIQSIKDSFSKSALESESVMVPCAMFIGVASPLFYFVNLYLLAPQQYSNASLRILLFILCLLLVIKNHWPKSLRPYLPLIWHGMLLISMPFFGTFMLLENHFSAAWSMNFTALLILMMLLVDWALYTVLVSSGVILAALTYFITAPNPFMFYVDSTPITFLDFLINCITCIIMGVVFSRKKQLIEHAKLEGMRIVGANIAHELRTPLASIQLGARGAKNYFPSLLEGYRLAQKNNLEPPYISEDHLKTLLGLLDAVEAETRYSNTIIDMLLIKSKPKAGQPTEVNICSISDCLRDALHRYPFKPNESDLITWDKTGDFCFKGESLLIMHVFFNLIKNALYFIEKAGKGNIKIAYETEKDYNLVHFRDTATGIPEETMPKLFERFYTYGNRGTGLGLAFCKFIMQDLGGDIRCHSVYGEFTDFSLCFPKISAQ